MQVKVEEISHLERKVIITLPDDVVSQAYETRLKKLAGEVAVKGFRPGKTPLSVVKQRYGEAIRGEVVSELMRSNLFDALTERDINPVNMPFVDLITNVPGQDLVFSALFEVLPSVELTHLHGQTVQQKSAEVSQADIDEMIENLRNQHKEFVPVDRPIQTNDQVKMDFEGTLNGVPFEGGKAEDTDLVIGSHTMIEGFESGLIGHKVGETVELNLTFPTEYHSKELAGKETVFKINIKRVGEPKKAELDAAFFHKIGIHEGGVEKLHEQIRAEMDRQLTQKLRAFNKEQVLNKLLELNSIEVPKSLVDKEIEHMREETKQRMKQMFGVDYLPEIPRDTMEHQAVKRLKLGLLVSEYVKQHQIKPDADKVRALIEEIASTYEEPEHVVNWYYSNKDELHSVESAVVEQEVVDKLLADATVEPVKASYNEIVNPKRTTDKED